jgi:hypothetical protein
MEPLTPITAEQKFMELLRKRDNSEFLKTLKDFKEACDKIEVIKGKMSYAAVAKVAERSISTIKNDPEGHCTYVKLRQKEYEAKKKTAPSAKDNAQEVSVLKPRYPASDLDQKTRSFIDGLWGEIANISNRNALLETTMTEIRKEVLDQTRENPLDARKMLRSGPDDTGSMAIVVACGDVPMTPLTPKLRQALEKVLELGGRHPFYVDKGSLFLKTSSQEILLIKPSELREIAAAIGKEVPDGKQKLDTL